MRERSPNCSFPTAPHLPIRAGLAEGSIQLVSKPQNQGRAGIQRNFLILREKRDAMTEKKGREYIKGYKT